MMATALTAASDGLLSVKKKTLWHPSTPRRVAAHCPATDADQGWTTWQAHLAGRKRLQLPPFLTGKSPAVLWAWPDLWGRTEVAATLGSPTVSAEALASRNGQPPSSAAMGLTQALQTVALAYALPTLSGKMSAEAWWKLTERLHKEAIDAQQAQVDWEDNVEFVVEHQLLAGELPLVLGYLLPELQPMRRLRKSARQVLSEALVELTDGEGTPHARLLPVLGPLWACWTRARWMGERLKRGCWSNEAETQYQWLVRHAIRLLDHDGRFAFCEASVPVPGGLLTMALDLAGDESDCAAAAAVVSRSVVPPEMDFDDDDLPAPATNSEWASLSVMAPDWSASAPRLAVAYADDPMSISLSVGRARLFAGEWAHATTCNDEPVSAVGEWEEVCWQSDHDCDYLELAIELEQGLKLERQILLSREDHVLYVADVVISADGQPRRLEHSLSLPVGRGIEWRPESETRDGVLADAKRRAAVLPLALPEWRCDERVGSLELVDGSLTLTQQAAGRAMCCPLMLDLKPRRVAKERTWRQLTVAETLQEVAHDVAVGYRIQSGRDQWLVYRSLAQAANRTLLGQNLSSEFCAGRFYKSGQVAEWIEIEAD